MLYEPTNIIPSAMTQTGTVAATTDDVNIQWQVNGNSAMTLFQIDVMQNNADSTFVYSTGVVTENPTVAQGYSLPFYGKDRFGDYVQFVYQPNETWSGWSGNAISDGNNYKFRITQFFQENGTACKVPITSKLSAGTTYYFSYSVNGVIQYVSFTVANASYFVSGNTIYFNFSHNAGWVVTSGDNSRIITDITFSVSETQPSGTQLSGAEAVSSGDTFYNQFFTAQNSASSFITRTEPTLTIAPLTETPVASASQNFTATYLQEQGDNINTVRWQLFNADDMSTPVDDTGDISTSVLSYGYNGLFDGQSYSVICMVTTESGVTVSATLDFSVQYEQGTYTGNFTAQSLCHEDANLLKWDTVSGIPGVANPEGSAVVSNGQLSLPASATVSWSQKSNSDNTLEPLNLQQPWTAVWNGNISTKADQSFSFYNRNRPNNTNIITSVVFNSTNTLLLASGGVSFPVEQECHAFLFKIDNNFLTLVQELRNIPAARNTYIRFASFNTAGDTICFLPLRVDASNGIIYYSVSGSSLSYEGQIDISSLLEESTYSLNPQGACFCPNSELLFVSFQPTYSGQSPLFVYTKKTESGFSEFVNISNIFSNNGITHFSFNEDGSFMAVTYPRYVALCSISGETITLLNTIALEYTCVDISDIKNNLIAVLLSANRELIVDIFQIEENQLIKKSETVVSTNSAKGIVGISLDNNANTLLLTGYIGAGNLDAYIWTYIIDDNFNLQNEVEITKFANFYVGNGYRSGQITFTGKFSPNGKLFVVGLQNPGGIAAFLQNSIISIPEQNIEITKDIGRIKFENNSLREYVSLNNNVTTGTIMLTPSEMIVNAGTEEGYSLQESVSIDYTQTNLTSLEIEGTQVCNYVAVIDGNGEDISQYVATPNFEPKWNNGDLYTVDLLANFSYGIDGGTATATGTGFRIYRRTADGTENIELATLPSTTIALRDYGIKSNESYIYDFYVYDANGAFMGVRSTEATPLKRQFKRFSLLSTQYNEIDKCYHVVKEYQFSCNIQDMSVSNNSNKSYVQNFTPYPTVFQSTANYASGTLQALIGFVDPKAYKYWDSTQLMDELNALSTTTNTLFLKDMKGHLWMVDVGTVQMTATQKTREMQVTISLPWTEIGDASDVSIIQTPDDEGWNTDAQVLDVKFDVDVETGLLQVVYPFPYNGTAFYLVGVTPEGVVSAVQPLPSTASQPTDGQLKAVVRHK